MYLKFTDMPESNRNQCEIGIRHKRTVEDKITGVENICYFFAQNYFSTECNCDTKLYCRK